MRRGCFIAMWVCLAALLAAAPASAAEPPANDAFAAAAPITGDSATLAVDTTGATSEPGETALYPGIGGSVWFTWTPAASGPATLDTCDSGFASVLGVFTGTSLSSLTPITVDSGSCAPGSHVQFYAQAGQTYRIAIAGQAGATGTATLRLNAPPVNDAFGTATALGEVDGVLYVPGTTRRATREPDEGDHAGAGGGHSVWYRWTATRTSQITIETCSGFASYDTALAVYTGTAVGELEEVAADDDDPGCLTSPHSSGVTFAAVAGTQYRIAVDGHAGASGDFQLVIHAPPLNDAFAGARDVSGVDGYYGTTAGATKEPGEPQHGGDAGGHSVWFSWRAPRDREVTIATCYASFDTLLAVYTGSSLAALTPVGTPAAGEPGCDHAITFAATAGTVYRIAVDGRAGASGSYDLELPPANDDFAGALALDDENGFSAYASTARTTSEPGEPNHGGSGHSLWYRWTAPTDQAVTLDTCESDAAAVIAVYTGNAIGALDRLAGSSGGAGFCAGDSPGAGVTFEAVAGTTYRIAIDAAGAELGDVALVLSTAPANDAFAASAPLTGASVSGTTRAATKEPGEPDHAGDPGGHSVWYRWTAPSSGPVTLQACGTPFGYGTGFDTLLAVYTGSEVAALAPVASGASNGSCYFTVSGSTVTFVAEAGTTYRIAVDGQGGGAGEFSLSFPPAPSNDAFADAALLSGTFAYATATTNGATKETGEPDHAGDGGGHSVWYAWTAPTTGRYVLDTCSAGFDTLLAVYTGGDVGTLDEIAANDDAPSCGSGSHGSLLTFDATAGTTYRFAVDGKAGASGSAQLALGSRPFNDDFENGYPLVGSTTISTKGATRQPGEPQHAGDAGGASIWFTLTPSEDEPVTINTCATIGVDTLLAVYTGSSVAALTEVAASDDSEACGPGSKASSVTFDAVAGTTYRIAVDGKGGVGGFVSLELIAKPADDDFVDAQSLYGEGTYVGSTRGGTREDGEPAHAGDSTSPTVWYRWTPPASGPATFDTCTGPGTDTILAVYAGTDLAALTAVAANDDAPGCGGRQSRVTFDATAGTEYRIAVAGKDGGGTFYLTYASQPSNDGFASALPLSSSASQSNRQATKEPGEPDHAGNAGGHSLWYRWTAPVSGAVVLDTCDSSFDTLLAVYTGTSVDALELVADNDDASGCRNLGRARVSFEATAGTEYRIALDGKDGASGSTNLTLQTAPANDAFAAAEDVGTNPYSVYASTGAATVEPGEPAHAGQPGGHSVWYRWTPAQDTAVTLDTCGASFDTLLAVYTGDALGALEPVASGDDDPECGDRSRVTFQATAGTTYRIAVDGKAGVSGSMLLSFTLAPENDRLASATELPEYGGEQWDTTRGATAEADEPQHAGAPAAHSVWYRWTAPKSGDTTLHTCSPDTEIDTRLAVYTGDAVDALTPVASSDDECGSGSRLKFHATAGTTYLIAVDGDPGWFVLRLTPRPRNDDLADASGIGYGTATDGSTENATGEPGEPDGGGRSVWYGWWADRSGDVRIAVCDADLDTLLSVYTGSTYASLTKVAANDDSDRCGAGATGSALTFTATFGTTYWIAVDAKDGAEGAFKLRFGQPANDNFAEAQTLTGREATAVTATVAAGAEAGEPDHAGVPARNSVWYRWTAPVDGAYTFSTCAGYTDTRLAVYRGDALATLTEVAANDDAGPLCSTYDYASSVTFEASAGVEYRIAVDAAYSSTLALVGPPANDAFDDARDLGSDLYVSSQRNTNASAEAGESGTHTVWYRWTAPRSGETTLNTCDATFGALLAVSTGTSLDGLTPVASGDGCGEDRVTFTAVAGTEYRIAVDGRDGATGTFGLHFEIPPANDAFADAWVLGPGFDSSSGSTAHASVEPGEPQHAGVPGGRSVWFRWTATATTRVVVDTCGSSLDTLLAVYGGTRVDALTELAANDDSLACVDGTGSRAVFDGVAGTSYAIAVDGKAGATGAFSVRVTPVPVNDDFEDATAIAPGATSVFVDTRGASLQPGEPAHADRDDVVSVWYRWTAPVTGTVQLGGCGAVVAVYTGSELGALTPVAAAADGCLTFEAVTGTVYRIAVASAEPWSFAMTLALPPANDRFDAAERISQSGAVVDGTTALAGHEPGEPDHGGRTAAHSVWYRWVAPANAHVRITTCGSGFDTTLGVYTGSDVGALNTIASGDDSDRCGSASSVEFDAVAGTDYAIAVDGAATGTLRLVVNPPANDDFQDAAVLTGAAASSASTTLGATAQAGEPSHWYAADASVWWAWTAPSTGTFAVSTCGSAADTVLAVYRGSALGALTWVGANDDSGCAGGGARVTFGATAGEQYRFAVDRRRVARGRVVLTLNAPTNDLFSAPVTLTGADTSVSGSNVGASVEDGEPLHAGNAGGHSLWFSWRAPSSGLERVSVCGAPFAALLGVYTGGTVGSLTKTASVDGCELTFSAVAGTTYRIALDGRDGATGAFTLSLQRVSPLNDAFAAATALIGAAPTVTQATGGATAEPGEPAHAGTAAAHSVWFRWTAPATATVRVDTCGSDYGTRLAVYTGGALGSLTETAAVDGCDLSFAAAAGIEYRIAVDGAATGTLVLHVNRPANDDRADAAPATSTVTGTTAGATREVDDPATGFATVWYRWTAPADGPVGVASTCAGGAHTLVQVFDQGSLTGRLDAAGCDTPGSTRARGTFTAAAGNVYLIAVGLKLDGPGGAFQLRVGVPANDDFADAATLAGTHAEVSASNVAAGSETGEPLGGGASLWYAWTAPAGGEVTVDTCGSAIATLLGVYTGTAVDALTPVAEADCHVTFTAVKDARYLIAVDGQAGAHGALALTLDAAVDTTPPDTTIDSGPDGPIKVADATFAFSSSEPGSTFECSLDGAEFAACVTPLELHGLDEGAHTLRVRAVDPAGNADPEPAERAFSVDRTAPDTEITDGPGEFTSESSVSIAFRSGEPGAAFECAFDDGAFRDCSSPYTRSGLDDGDHTFRVRAVDPAGNTDSTPATLAFAVDALAPETTITGDPPHDVASRSATVAFEASKGGTTFACRLDDAAAAPCTSPHELTGLTDGPHRFTVTSTDRAGHTDATPAEWLFIVDGSPLTARAGDDRTALVGEPVAFDGGGSRPLGGVESYVWDFGDGATGTGATASHAYARAGDYTAKLTVTGAGGATATATARVHVVAGESSVTVTVRDEGSGAALGGADVLVMLAGGARVQARTGADGEARLHGLPDGGYTAYVNASGHVPATVPLAVAGGSGSAAAALRAGPVGAVTLDVHRMTLEEIEAAGIDPDDPANQHVVKFSVHMNFAGGSHDFDGMAGNGGWVSCGCPDGVSGRAYWPSDGSDPTIVWMIMDGEARFLKEFFAVDLLVQNLAPGGFTFTGGSATLNLPDGMVLAPTSTPQTATRTIADVPGGEAKGTTWYVRGDREGHYDLSVDYRATLAPFGTPVVLRGETRDPIHVWGASAVELVVEADERAQRDRPFTVRVGLRNVADIPVYNPAIELERPADAGFVEQPRQRHAFSARAIAPGDTFWSGDYIVVPDNDGTLDVSESFVGKLAGDEALDAQVTSRPRDFDDDPEIDVHARKDALVVEFAAVDGATGYELHRLIDRDTGFDEDPLPVDWLTPTKAFVELDPGTLEGIAVSSIVDGRPTLVHPVVWETPASTSPYPQVELVETSKCGSYPAQGKLVFTDPDFPMTSYSMTFDGVESIRGLNDRQGRFEVKYKLGTQGAPGNSLVVRAKNSLGEEGPELRDSVGLCERYVALGDSYSSGEGANEYNPGTRDDDVDGESPYNNRCHRSRNAYPRVLARERDDVETPIHVACSGALVADFEVPWKDDFGHSGDGRNLNEEAQLDNLNGNEDLVTFTIGGNDAYFADVLADCAWSHWQCKGKWSEDVDDAISDLGDPGGTLDRLYDRIEAKVGTRTRVVVLGYAPIFAADPDWGCLESLIFESDGSWMRNREYVFNQRIKARALEHGFEYVDLWERFKEHEVCGDDVNWINAAVPGNKEHSFHPNELGHAEMAAAIEDLFDRSPAKVVTLKTGESSSKTYDVAAGTSTFSAGASWPGSDVELELISPSGRRIDRSTVSADVQRTTTPTSEHVVVQDPEPGEWTVLMHGLEMDPDGEDVALELDTAEAVPQLPIALATADRTDGEAPLRVRFDAGDSSSPRSGALALHWDFGDGTAADGATAEHVYRKPGKYRATLTVTDAAGLHDTYALLIEATEKPPVFTPTPTPTPDATPTPLPAPPAPVPAPPTGGGEGTPPAAEAPTAFTRISVHKRAKLRSLRKRLVVTVSGARKGVKLRVTVTARRGKKTIKLGSTTVKATGKAKQNVRIKLKKRGLKAGMRLRVRVSGTGAGAERVTRTATVKVRR